jgi:hypothetical protein
VDQEFLLKYTKRNALTYALLVVNFDEGMLAAHLGIPMAALVDYLHGKQEVPMAVFRQAIRLLLEKTKVDAATQREVLRKIGELNGRC